MYYLVVWIPKIVLVVPVFKEHYLGLISEIEEREKHIYCNIYVPEIFTMRTVRYMYPRDLKMYEYMLANMYK